MGFLYCVPVSGGTMCVRLCACVRMGGWLSVGGGLWACASVCVPGRVPTYELGK